MSPTSSKRARAHAPASHRRRGAVIGGVPARARRRASRPPQRRWAAAASTSARQSVARLVPRTRRPGRRSIALDTRATSATASTARRVRRQPRQRRSDPGQHASAARPRRRPAVASSPTGLTRQRAAEKQRPAHPRLLRPLLCERWRDGDRDPAYDPIARSRSATNASISCPRRRTRSAWNGSGRIRYWSYRIAANTYFPISSGCISTPP